MTGNTHPSEGSAGQESAALRIGIAVVECRGQVLVGLRDSQTVLGGKHEFPGGKCLPTETAADCAVRECLEETGIAVEVVAQLQRNRHIYDHGELELAFFSCRPISDEREQPQGNFWWIPVPELLLLNFPSGNRQAVELVLQRQADRAAVS